MLDIGKRIKVEVEGQGEVTLLPSQHVASGGEGHVWRIGTKDRSRAVKLWDEPDRVLVGRMEERLRALSALQHPNVITPDALVRNGAGGIAGYTMPWVEGWALPLAFTNDWRTTNNFSEADALHVAARMRQATQAVHAQGIVQGDPNELNLIGVGREPRYIDVDSWIPRGFAGDKVLPTILDPRSAPFTIEADWFAWAVVTFQLMVGIHPYRGTHPDFGRADTAGRMNSGVSVFRPEVRVSPAVRPFTLIPSRMLQWYRDVFEGGLRSVPPDPMDTRAGAVQGQVKMVAAPPRSGSVGIAHVYDCGLPLRMSGSGMLMLADGTLISLADGRTRGGRVHANAALLVTGDGTVVSAWAEQGMLMWSSLRGGASSPPQSAGIACSGVWEAEGRIFAVVEDGIQEMQAQVFGSRIMLLPAQKWALSAATTVLGQGVALYSALGAEHVVLPNGQGGVPIIRVRELDGMKMLRGIRRGGVSILSLIDRSGAYRRATLVLNDTATGVGVHLEDADSGELGAVVTENGLTTGFDTQGHLYIRHPVTGASRIADAGNLAGGILVAGGAGVFLWRDGRMNRITLS